ncbi:nuclear cap-binding protein subunit 1 [Senna tora]|uniref:Nuclear cap-binding protein subunit 1 n=1 Tax=Senna tora TaxID=362788 RepID=A0A834SEF9_9FABA|nr:nuclear cap-binding protein subunit 1 [Senna tora]
MSGHTRKDMIRNDCIKEKVRVAPIIEKLTFVSKSIYFSIKKKEIDDVSVESFGVSVFFYSNFIYNFLSGMIIRLCLRATSCSGLCGLGRVLSSELSEGRWNGVIVEENSFALRSTLRGGERSPLKNILRRWGDKESSAAYSCEAGPEYFWSNVDTFFGRNYLLCSDYVAHIELETLDRLESEENCTLKKRRIGLLLKGEVLADTISENQSAFVGGRQILDAALVANEVVEDVRRRRKQGLVFKLDFEKAYDRVNWGFLDKVLDRKVVDVLSRMLSRGMEVGENVLSFNIPLYYLSLFKIPVTVSKRIESIMRDFLWSGKGEIKKDHLGYLSFLTFLTLRVGNALSSSLWVISEMLGSSITRFSCNHRNTPRFILNCGRKTLFVVVDGVNDICIVLQLLMLPQPPFKPIYYTLVIIDLCKALPGAFPAVVAGAVRALFEKIVDLDMECRIRLILWFSHHLSNFQFIWPWEEWAYVLDLPKWAPQRVFVQEVLEREVRLSYWDKVKQSVENAPGLEELLPPKGGPNFSYGAEDDKENAEQALSRELNDMVKGRVPVREIIAWIDENVFPNNGLEVTLRVVIQTLLNIGSKSFTHLITVLERYGQVIAKVCSDQDKQVMLIAEVSTFWKSNTQMTAIAIDRMMGYRLVSNLAIVRWVFSAENIEQFHTSDRPWEILRNAVSKTFNRISDLRKEILSLKKSIPPAEDAAKEAKAELDAAESKLTLVDGEPVLGENPVRLNRLKSRAEKAKEEEVSLRESLEAKEALLARAIDENEALFLSLYKNFSSVLIDRLPEASAAQTLRELKSTHDDEMAVDPEEQSAMELDNENQTPQNSKSNGGKTRNIYNIGEKEQWCITTLGYVKAFTRQYAAEIWPHIEKLDTEVLKEDAHHLFQAAVYSGLRRPINED